MKNKSDSFFPTWAELVECEIVADGNGNLHQPHEGNLFAEGDMKPKSRRKECWQIIREFCWSCVNLKSNCVWDHILPDISLLDKSIWFLKVIEFFTDTFKVRVTSRILFKACLDPWPFSKPHSPEYIPPSGFHGSIFLLASYT